MVAWVPPFAFVSASHFPFYLFSFDVDIFPHEFFKLSCVFFPLHSLFCYLFPAGNISTFMFFLSVFHFIFSLGKLNMWGYPFLLFHVLSESRDVQSLFLVCGRRNGLPTEPEP